jgi:hypothetical protein
VRMARSISREELEFGEGLHLGRIFAKKPIEVVATGFRIVHALEHVAFQKLKIFLR